MSEEQPRRPNHQDQPIRYGDVFNVGGEFASKPITPRDAATVQSVESQIFGQTQKGGPAAMMESAAAKNERAGLVSHKESTHLARNEGVTLSDQGKNVGGNRVLSETLGEENVGQFVEADGDDATKGTMDSEEPFGSTADDDLPASVKAPQVRATQNFDFMTNQSAHADTTLNPRFSESQNENTQSNVPSSVRT
ncbi:hypothetical protein RIF29_39136 [Crotalaria pallida]|uniref:SMP domain-containing protein n=1 Tax=Crotalaria pallida TaxID=3830 RepID=A0AAN9E2D3_CROPI